VLFALLHAMNGLFGPGWGATGLQVFLAFLGGTAFFVTLMATGSLALCMLLHAAWDFGSLGQLATERRPRPPQAVLVAVTWVAALAGAIALAAS
jgi:membrane protease YdiL (CAAX protease family)